MFDEKSINVTSGNQLSISFHSLTKIDIPIVAVRRIFKADSQNIPTSEVLACFSPFITARRGMLDRPRITETESCTIYFDTTSQSINHLMVSRPCGDTQLFRCIFQVMKLGNFVLFEPGVDRIHWYCGKEVIAHLPEGMAEALGEARIAANWGRSSKHTIASNLATQRSARCP